MNRPSSGAKYLVLLAAGHAHVHVPQELTRHRPAGLNITVISPYARLLYSGMTPGYVASHHALDACVIALHRLLADSAARYIPDSAVALDAKAKTVTLAGDKSVAYDWLSLNTGPAMDREEIEAKLPGARRYAMFVLQIEAFAELWPRVLDLARQRPVHLAVVGAGAAGMELATAAAHALSGSSCAPSCRARWLPAKRLWQRATRLAWSADCAMPCNGCGLNCCPMTASASRLAKSCWLADSVWPAMRRCWPSACRRRHGWPAAT